MKKILCMALILSFVMCFRAEASGDPFQEPIVMRVTCYIETGNPTASGIMPFEGGCAAKREWIGCVAAVYDMNMNFIGYFDINDTGGHERIKSGQSIDIYRENMEAAREWIRTYGDYCYVKIIEAEG